MGKWAEAAFGKATFGRVGIVIAGTIKSHVEDEIVGLFDKVLSRRDIVYHAYRMKKGKHEIPFVTNVYGAPAMVDVMSEMHDGGCRTLVFIGSAYGFMNLPVATIVVTDKCFHFDGIYHHIEPDRKSASPDKKLKAVVETVFKKNKLPFSNGTNISVPAVTFQPRHANREYSAIKPKTLEMELAACFSRAQDLGIRAVGILVVSDNRSHSIGSDGKAKRDAARRNVLESVLTNLKQLDLSPIKGKRFTIDSYLASVIEDPSDETNIYKQKK